MVLIAFFYLVKIKISDYTEGYNESTEPIDAVDILPLARLEPTTITTPPEHPLLGMSQWRSKYFALHQTSTLPTAPLRHPQKRMFRKRCY